MTYELLPTGRGVLIDRTPVLQDVRDTYKVSFLLPERGAYLALFTGEDGIEYTKTIERGICKIPTELLKKEQYIGVIVSELDGERIMRSWECEPLRITAYLYMRQTQWQVSGGMTDKSAYDRMVELERLYADSLAECAALKAAVSAYKTETAALVAEFQATLNEQAKTLASLKKSNDTLTVAYNEASKVVNDLAERVAAMEKHYDPTIV